MVLRMSISSVPGTNSVFFASFPIDDLPIDKVWEKVRALSRGCQVVREKVSLFSNRRPPAIPLLSDTMRQFRQLISDKTALLKAAHEGLVPIRVSREPDCRIGEFPRAEYSAVGSRFPPKPVTTN